MEEDLWEDLVDVEVDVGEALVDGPLDSWAEVAKFEVWEGIRPVEPLAGIEAAGC